MTDNNVPQPLPKAPPPQPQWASAQGPYQQPYGQPSGYANPQYLRQQSGYPVQVNMFGHTAPAKSPGVAALLAAVLGPLGMFYATVTGALVMIAANFFILLIGFLTFGLGLLLLFASWACGIAWAYQAAESHNKALYPRPFAAPYSPSPMALPPPLQHLYQPYPQQQLYQPPPAQTYPPRPPIPPPYSPT